MEVVVMSLISVVVGGGVFLVWRPDWTVYISATLWAVDCRVWQWMFFWYYVYCRSSCFCLGQSGYSGTREWLTSPIYIYMKSLARLQGWFHHFRFLYLNASYAAEFSSPNYAYWEQFSNVYVRMRFMAVMCIPGQPKRTHR